MKVNCYVCHRMVDEDEASVIQSNAPWKVRDLWVCNVCSMSPGERTPPRYDDVWREGMMALNADETITAPPGSPADRDALADALIAWAADVDNAIALDNTYYCVFCGTSGMSGVTEHEDDCLHLRARALQGDDA